MTQVFSIPADLADSDLVMSQIKEIKGIRDVASAAQRTIDGPGEKALRMASARIIWAKDAEEAVVNGRPVPPKPGNKEGDAAPEDYLGDD